MQNSVAKKIFAVGVAASTVLMGLAPFAAHAVAHGAGTNVLLSDGITVAMVMPDGTRRSYTSGGAFLSYGFNSFATVVPATAEDMALTAGALIPPQDGKIFCATQTKGSDVAGECSLVTGGMKAAFTSEAVFKGLGFSFARGNSGDSSFLTKTSNVDNIISAHRPGVLIHFVNSSGHDTVYLVGPSGLLGVPDINTFQSWGYSFSDVIAANAADMALPLTTGVMAVRTLGQLSPTVCLSNCGSQVITGNVTVSLASDNPASGSIINGQAIADLGHFNFSGSGTVTTLKVHRIGVSSDTVLNNVYLYNGNTKITDAGSLSNGVVTFSNAGGLFTVNGSTVISVKADIISSATAGQTVGVSITGPSDITGVTVGGSFPVSGNLMTVAVVTDLATAAIGSITSASSQVQAGTMNVTLWSAPITVGTRKVWLKYVSFKQIGSAPNDALQNIKLLVDGVQVGSTASIDANNRVSFDLTGVPLSLMTGSRTVEIHGDVIKGSSRTFSFQIQTASDIVLVDSNYGVNLTMTGTIPAASTTSTISSGSVSVQNDATFTANQVVNNTAGVTFGQFTMKAYGEDIKVMSLQVVPTFAGNAQSTEGLNNVSVFVNGAQVGSSQNFIANSTPVFPGNGAIAGSASTGSLVFGSGNLFTIPAGTQVTVAFKGDVVLKSSGSTVTSITTAMYIPANQLQGNSSFTTTPAAATTYTPSTALTVVSSNTQFSSSKDFSFASQTLSPNTSNQKMGSFILQAGNAEPVRITNLNVALTNGAGNIPLTDYANLYVSDNTTPVNPAASQNFGVNFTMQPTTTHTVGVFMDIGNVATADLGSTTQVTLVVTGTGVNSGQAITATIVGQLITVNTATVTLPTVDDGAGAVSQLVLGGTTLNQGGSFKVISASGVSTIKELKFAVEAANGTTALSGAVTSVAVAGCPTTAPVLTSGSAFVAYLTGCSITVPSGTGGIDVQPNLTYNTVGTTGATTGTTARVALTYIKYNTGSGADVTNSTLNATSSPMVLVAAIPTVQKNAGSPQSSSGYVPDAASELLRFDVIPSTGGTIQLGKISFKAIYSGTFTSTNTLNLYDLTSDPGMNTSLGSVAFGGTSGVQKSITLSSNKSISGSGHTFVIKGDTATGGTWSAGNSIRIDLTAVNDTAEASGTDWQWNDNTVSASTYNNGYLLRNLTVTGGTQTK